MAAEVSREARDTAGGAPALPGHFQRDIVSLGEGPVCDPGYTLLPKRILTVAVGAHPVTIQLTLRNVHSENQGRNQPKIEK